MIVVETVGGEDDGGDAEGRKAEDERRILGEAGEGVGEDLGVLVEERARTPGDAEDAHDADEAGAEHGAERTSRTGRGRA